MHERQPLTTVFLSEEQERGPMTTLEAMRAIEDREGKRVAAETPCPAPCKLDKREAKFNLPKL